MPDYNIWPYNLIDGSRDRHHQPATCAADSSYVDASGSDDAPEFQDMVTFASRSRGMPVVEIPAGRTYCCRSAITIPTGGIEFKGRGALTPSGVVIPCGGIVWGGSAGGTLFDVAVAAQNIPALHFENIGFMGRTDGGSQPANFIRFRGTGGFLGAIDSGTIIKNCWFSGCTGNAISIEGGATNFLIDGGRMDSVGGYGIYGTGSISMGIVNKFTWAPPVACNGFLFIDGEAAAGTASCDIDMFGVHLEINADLNQTYNGGTNAYDKRGLIRLGVNAADTFTTHRIRCYGLRYDSNFGHPSHSIIQVTATGTTNSDFDNTEMIDIDIRGAKGLDRPGTPTDPNDILKVLGGRIATAYRPNAGTYISGDAFFRFCIGKNENGANYTHVRNNLVRSTVHEPITFANLPGSGSRFVGMELCISDCNTATFNAIAAGGGANIMKVLWDGSNWRAR